MVRIEVCDGAYTQGAAPVADIAGVAKALRVTGMRVHLQRG